jgi:hypothetical protein
MAEVTAEHNLLGCLSCRSPGVRFAVRLPAETGAQHDQRRAPTNRSGKSRGVGLKRGLPMVGQETSVFS